MKNILLMEGSSQPARERAAHLGQETTAEVYVRALLAENPNLQIDVLYGADEGAQPPRSRPASSCRDEPILSFTG